MQGLILASYFYGYVVAQVIGGRIADFLGAKRLFGGATLLSSILTCVTPFISELPAAYMVALRVILGLVHVSPSFMKCSLFQNVFIYLFTFFITYSFIN